MTKYLCAVVAAFAAVFSSPAFAGNLKVNLTPTQAVSAGAQWRVDGGAWRASGTTVNNLSNTSHVVSFRSTSGWVTPADINVTLTNGNTTTLTGTYVATASLKINLTPTSGQWRVDGGSWQANGATVTGLAPGSHAITYQTVSGYTAPAAENVTLTSGQTTTLSRAYVQLAQLTVNLVPTSGKWRIDGGAWRNNGTTATGLTPGAHNLEYLAVSGYASPAAESITLTPGQSLGLTRNYTALSKLKITLTPTTGKWRVDAGAWNNSAALVSDLTPGNHSVEYQEIAGYNSPAPETVTLVSGQTTNLSRAYVQLAQLTLNLTPTSAQWRVDGGAWRASGVAATGLTPGSHAVEYGTVNGYSAPAAENISLNAGQSLSVSRSYTALATLTVNLSPASGQWRVDGGAWQNSGSSVGNLSIGTHTLEYSALSNHSAPATESISLASGQSLSLSRTYTLVPAQMQVTLSNSSGSFRIDGGAWLPSGTLTANLVPGIHTLDYQAVPGFSAPPSESVTLVSGQTTTLTRDYVQLAQITLALVPASGQWRIDGGAWQPSGSTLLALPGDHVIDFASLAECDSPAAETINVAPGGTFSATRSYLSLRPTLKITLNPAAGQWRVDGGAWQASDAVIAELGAGNHTIDYLDIGGNYDPLASEMIELALRQNAVLARSYPLKPLAAITVTLEPAAAQWRLDNGAWQSSGATLGDLTYGVSHTIEYAPAVGYVAPPSETLTLASGEHRTLSATYTPLASVAVTFVPPGIGAQWRIDGGDWRNGGTSAFISYGVSHTVEYSDVAGYAAPAASTFTLGSGETRSIGATYTALAWLSVSATPSWIPAQWRVDGGAWRNLSTGTYVTPGTAHTVEYSDYIGFVTPDSTTLTLNSGETRFVTATYKPLASVSVSFNPSWIPAQWRIDGGPWRNIGTNAYNLAYDVPHLIEFSDYLGYVTPASTTVTLNSGETRFVTATYTPLAAVSVSFNPSWIPAQWRIDGGPWRSVGTNAYNLAYGVPHLIEYSDYIGFVTPDSTTLTLNSGETRFVTATYKPLASVSVSFNPSWIPAQWRIDGGPWRNIGTNAYNLAYDVPHLIEYSDYLGYVTPASTTVTLYSGETRFVTATYTPLASVSVSFDPSWITAQWRIDGGPWRNIGTNAYNLAYGVPHLIEYSDYLGYVTPASTTVTLNSGETRFITATYTPLATLSLSLSPMGVPARWRVDGGQWNASGSPLYNLATGPHTIEYSAHEGYLTPPTETVTLAPSYNMISRTYATDPAFTVNYSLASITVSLDPTYGEWRLDGGAWNTSGATLYNRSPGPHTIEYAALADYITPPTETLNFTGGSNPTVYTSYISLDPAQLTITTNPTSGQWRIFPYQTPPGGAWHASGETVTGLNPGAYQIEYSAVNGYNPPSLNYVQLQPDEVKTLTADYGPKQMQLKITLVPTTGKFRLNGGPWQPSGATAFGPPQTFLVEFQPVAGYTTPPAVSVTVNPGEVKQVTYTYTPL